MKPLPILIACAAAALLPLWAQAEADGAQVTNAYRGVMQDRSANSDTEALYVEKCSMCHRQMGMGTVLLARRLGPEQAILERHPGLNRQLIEFAVREGIGNMPRISRGEVSDDQLAAIISWLLQDQQATGEQP